MYETTSVTIAGKREGWHTRIVKTLKKETTTFYVPTESPLLDDPPFQRECMGMGCNNHRAVWYAIIEGLSTHRSGRQCYSLIKQLTITTSKNARDNHWTRWPCKGTLREDERNALPGWMVHGMPHYQFNTMPRCLIMAFHVSLGDLVRGHRSSANSRSI